LEGFVKKNIFVWISLLFIIFIGAVYFSGMVKNENYYQVGDTFRPVTLTSISGELISLQKFQGKILFINFYASW
jgi:hypothetical protein